MRVVAIVFAALLTLGLAAFGVVAAQNPAGTGSLIALARHALSPAQATNAPAATAQAHQTQTAQAAPVQTPVIKVSQTTSAAQSTTPSTPPAELVQNPAASTPPAPAAASTHASLWPTALPQCNNPDALGMSRIVQIDTTGGPAFGTEHFKQYDFLREKEVVLTFDDGPWPENTEMVLKALKDNCVRATFFEIGEHATWAPQ